MKTVSEVTNEVKEWIIKYGYYLFGGLVSSGIAYLGYKQWNYYKKEEKRKQKLHLLNLIINQDPKLEEYLTNHQNLDLDSIFFKLLFKKIEYHKNGKNIVTYECEAVNHSFKYTMGSDMKFPNHLIWTPLLLAIHVNHLENIESILKRTKKYLTYEDELKTSVKSLLISMDLKEKKKSEKIFQLYKKLTGIKQFDSNPFISFQSEKEGIFIPLNNDLFLNQGNIYDQEFKWIKNLIQDDPDINNIWIQDEESFVYFSNKNLNHVNHKTGKITKLGICSNYPLNYHHPKFYQSINLGGYLTIYDTEIHQTQYEHYMVDYVYTHNDIVFLFNQNSGSTKVYKMKNRSIVLSDNENNDQVKYNIKSAIVLKDQFLLYAGSPFVIGIYKLTDDSLQIIINFTLKDYSSNDHVFIEKINDDLIVTGVKDDIIFWDVKYSNNIIYIVEKFKIHLDTKFFGKITGIKIEPKRKLLIVYDEEYYSYLFNLQNK